MLKHPPPPPPPYTGTQWLASRTIRREITGNGCAAHPSISGYTRVYQGSKGVWGQEGFDCAVSKLEEGFDRAVSKLEGVDTEARVTELGNFQTHVTQGLFKVITICSGIRHPLQPSFSAIKSYATTNTHVGFTQDLPKRVHPQGPSPPPPPHYTICGTIRIKT